MATKTETDSPIITKYLPILQEIQRKVGVLVAVTFVASLVGFIYYQKILNFFLKFFNFKGITVVLTNPYQFFDLAVNTGLATGILVAMPLFAIYLVRFLKPALKPHEYQLLIRLVPIAFVLFIAGFLFGAWVMQYVISIYSQVTLDFNVGNFWDIGHFFAQILIVGISLGLVFELPIVLTVLLRLKVVNKSQVSSKRRFVYAGILVFAALLPPNDVISLSVLTIVPLFLFELTLLFNRSY